jgi:hypothetical protein
MSILEISLKLRVAEILNPEQNIADSHIRSGVVIFLSSLEDVREHHLFQWFVCKREIQIPVFFDIIYI